METHKNDARPVPLLPRPGGVVNEQLSHQRNCTALPLFIFEVSDISRTAFLFCAAISFLGTCLKRGLIKVEKMIKLNLKKNFLDYFFYNYLFY